MSLKTSTFIQQISYQSIESSDPGINVPGPRRTVSKLKNETYHMFSNLHPGTTYLISVRARTAKGFGQTALTEITTNISGIRTDSDTSCRHKFTLAIWVFSLWTSAHFLSCRDKATVPSVKELFSIASWKWWHAVIPQSSGHKLTCREKRNTTNTAKCCVQRKMRYISGPECHHWDSQSLLLVIEIQLLHFYFHLMMHLLLLREGITPLRNIATPSVSCSPIYWLLFTVSSEIARSV